MIPKEIIEISPNDPNQLSETKVTKKSLTGSKIPVIIPKTMRLSRIFVLNFNELVNF